MNDSIDAFAINIGDATLPWVVNSLHQLFDAANDNNFRLFISMDVYASGASCYAGGNSCNGRFHNFDFDAIRRQLQLDRIVT